MNQEQYFEMPNYLPLHKAWPSKNRYFFSGKIFYGPSSDFCFHSTSWFLILFIYGIFAFTVIPEIWEENAVICLLTIVLFILVSLSLLLTSTTEPGIIPRKSIFMALQNQVPFPYNIGDITFEQFQ